MSESLSNSNDFIFFGCWNNINCSKKEKILNRNVVLALLKKLYSDRPIILAGDNWYSHNKKKKKILKTLSQELIKRKSNLSLIIKKNTKTYSSSIDSLSIDSNVKFYPLYVLETGYRKLFEISKNIDIILGNHDINSKNLDNFYDLNKCNQLGCMIKVQNDIIRKILSGDTINKQINDTQPIKNIYHYNDIHLYVCKPEIIQKKTGIYFLYLNTNIFEAKNVESINEYRELVSEKLESIDNKIKLLFIVAHHPFFGLKKKKGKVSIKNISDLYFKKKVDQIKVNAINDFLHIFNKYKSIYLCADIHNFQLCKLSSNICMIICGTGGASKDKTNPYVDNPDPIPLSSNLKDDIKVTDMYVHDSYGFSKINYSDSGNKVKIEYYKIINTDIKYYKFTYILTYTNKSWNIFRKTHSIKTAFIPNKIDFDTSQHCSKIRAENDDQINELIATVNDEKCGKKIKD